MNPKTTPRFIKFILAALPLFLAACALHYTDVSPYETIDLNPSGRPSLASAEPLIVLAGAILALNPTAAQAEAAAAVSALAAPVIGEAELTRLERNPYNGVEVLMRPRMRSSGDVTGRFRLEFEGDPSSIFLELTPRVLPGGEVALSARVETRRDGATLASAARDQVLQANSGIHGVYGPLTLDGRPVYALIKADVR